MQAIHDPSTIVESTDSLNGQKMTLDADNLHMALDALVQYSQPIDSIVREITSNCFDSHKEARAIRDQPIGTIIGTCETIIPICRPDTYEDFLEKGYHFDLYWALRDWEDLGVVVRISQSYPSDGERWIEFEDAGVGLSPLRVNKVLRLFFASTKRNTNDQLGFFGLGAKSPLGYTDMFEVRTRFCGTERVYVVHKGDETPEIQQILETETDQPNGTSVRVPIKNWGDHNDFRKACRKQLAYFDGVIFEGAFPEDMNNEFTIYEGDTFKYRPDAPFNQLHICYGQVYYPLDFNQAGLNEDDLADWKLKEEWGASLALKFDIGELSVIWNRENIKYTRRVKKLIQERVYELRDEIQEIYDEACGEIDTFEDWYRTLHSMEDGHIPVSNHDIKIPVKEKILKTTTPSYPKYEDRLSQLPKNILNNLIETHKRVKKGYIDQVSWSFDVHNHFMDPASDVYFVEHKYSTRKNQYIYWETNQLHFYLLKEGTRWTNINDEKQLKRLRNRFKVYYTKSSSYEATRKELEAMLEFEEEAIEAFKNTCALYDSVGITEEFEEYLRNKKKKKKKRLSYDPDVRFPCKKFSRGGRYSDSGWSRERYKWADVLRHDTLIVYGFRADDEALVAVGDYLSSSKNLRIGTNRCRVLKIAQNREEPFAQLANAYHVDDFLKLNHSLFRRTRTVEASTDIDMAINSDSWLSKIFPEYAGWRHTVEKYEKNTPTKAYGPVRKAINRRDTVDHDIIDQAKMIAVYRKKYPILDCVSTPSRYRGKYRTRDMVQDLKTFLDRPAIHPLLQYRYNKYKENQNSSSTTS